jgi:hypothetical protein
LKGVSQSSVSEVKCEGLREKGEGWSKLWLLLDTCSALRQERGANTFDRPTHHTVTCPPTIDSPLLSTAPFHPTLEVCLPKVIETKIFCRYPFNSKAAVRFYSHQRTEFDTPEGVATRVLSQAEALADLDPSHPRVCSLHCISTSVISCNRFKVEH